MRYLLLITLSWLSIGLTAQELTVFEAFTDHAVLQRDTEHPLWGWAKPGRRVMVAFNGERYRARVDRDSMWRVMLPATEAGGPYDITVSAGRETETLTDVYFGDVYLLSGQSNMEWRLAQSDPDSSRAAEIADEMIREIKVDRAFAERPLGHLPVREGWVPGVKHQIADFSGVGAYFAHYLREGGVDVPIGLLHSSWGGSRIEPWLSAEALGLANADDEMSAYESRRQSMLAEAKANYRSAFNNQEPPTEDRGTELGYLEDETDDSNWPTMPLPGAWEEQGYANVDGVFYFRRTFELSEEQAQGDATLFMGPVDDGDRTFINGQQVGFTQNAYSQEREYPVPASILRPGENTLAFKVMDYGGGGGLMGSDDMLRLETAAGSVPLAGSYRYQVGEMTSNGNPNKIPTILYNAMIAPLRDWPLTGVLWYQGESNAGPGDAAEYADHKRTLVTSWRERFGNDELPFYWVQLANFQAPPTQPDDAGWADLRAAQTESLDVSGTGQAVIIDIGEADDIHPRNKWEVGRRLSLHALKNIYGQGDIQAGSPVAERMETDGAMARVYFTETGEGLHLKMRDGERYPMVKSLAVEDVNGDWHWAVGALDKQNDLITVINPAGTPIRTVRYAWSNNPDDANLFSEEGLPVTPFELSAR